MTGAQWMRHAVARLAPLIGLPEAQRDARMMLVAATGWSTARLVSDPDDALPGPALAKAEGMLARRLRREPLAQILGRWAFYGRDFAVSRDVLTPRPDTETLIDHALAGPFERLIDLGTGSGAIAVTLLAERPQAKGVATDISADALAVARRNADAHGVADRLDLVTADWWTGVEGRFDLIVSNPPYVTATAYEHLQPEIRGFEPRAALTPGGDGLDAYRRLLSGLVSHSQRGTRVLFEIGSDQGGAVAEMMRASGLEAVRVCADLNGKDRVVAGEWP